MEVSKEDLARWSEYWRLGVAVALKTAPPAHEHQFAKLKEWKDSLPTDQLLNLTRFIESVVSPSPMPDDGFYVARPAAGHLPERLVIVLEGKVVGVILRGRLYRAGQPYDLIRRVEQLPPINIEDLMGLPHGGRVDIPSTEEVPHVSRVDG